ncbi:hypothetical protein [Chitinophaga eiseniae]|uniref:AAA+ ATPase domain-containing protein n=1 Tax=Chitinophaga eiseniae TaxID=634771 RepID=A0A847SK49_9BACT|nr:hypothetical protein [Chitinophaga eiseniae]NLR82271.1 hypothetical protein [Chitinophaga eiseniae]
MLTTDNYFASIKNIDISSLPDALQESHNLIAQATKNGSSWKSYHSSATFREMVDLHFQQLEHYIQGKKKNAAAKTAQRERKPATIIEKISTTNRHTEPGDEPQQVSRIQEELRLMRRFVNLHGKVKTKEQLLTFINTLQKAIVEKRIRKTSQWAEQIVYMQDRLLETYNDMKGSKTIHLKPETLDTFKKLIGIEVMLPSVSFIKRYIEMHQKGGMKERAKVLLSSIDKAINGGKVPGNDPYALELQSVKTNLQNFIADKKLKVLDIEPAALRGLQGVFSGLGCACQSLNGTGDMPTVMNSLDFVKLEFPTIGFTGKWLDFIGNPSPGFTVMVFGLPKFGKSTLCIDFAGYLAEQHGRVLYVAKEERLHRTLQDKIKSMRVSHPRLDVSSILPENLAPYDYIFLDSVNLLGLSVEQLRQLKARYPGKSFVFVFQSTKTGKFRGENSFQHDVDSVVEVPEWGKARQYGRYNQGGEMDIFEADEYRQAA